MASSSSLAEAKPPWAELPREITAAILHRLGEFEMLTTAQNVCKYWRSVSRDPAMWRCIDMKIPRDFRKSQYDVEKICRGAVDLSQGQLNDINIEHTCCDDLLFYISQRSSELRRLELAFPYLLTNKALTEAVKNFPHLEEPHLYGLTYIDSKAIESVGRSCSLLKSFTLNSTWHEVTFSECNFQGTAVAKSMPELRHLQLFGNKLSKEGLKAILDGCPHLESLDLRQCFYLYFDENLDELKI